MEPIPIGTIVKSISGRDAGKCFAVVGLHETQEGRLRLLVADGKSHTLNRPKKKNPIHLQTIGVKDSKLEEALNGHSLTDRALHKLLSAHEHHA